MASGQSKELCTLKGNDGPIVIINAPIVFDGDIFDWNSQAGNDYYRYGYEANTAIWVCKEIITKHQITSLRVIEDFYLEDSEENSSNRDKYYRNDTYGWTWYGYDPRYDKDYDAGVDGDYHLPNFHWDTSLADFKAKYGID